MIMEAQVIQLVAKAWKAARSGSQELQCLNALSKISSLSLNFKGVKFLSDTTDVPRKLDSLSRHPRINIRESASLVLNNWRTELYHHPTSESENPKPVKPLQNLKPVKPLQKPQFRKLGTARKNGVQKKKNLSKFDSHEGLRVQKQGGSASNCKHPLRNKIKEEVFEGLSMVFREANGERRRKLNSCDPVGIAARVEWALFDKWGLPSDGSGNRYRSLLFNLKDPKNSDFRRKILTGEIKAEELPKLSTQEMASNGRQQQNEMIKARALKKCIVGSKDEE